MVREIKPRRSNQEAFIACCAGGLLALRHQPFPDNANTQACRTGTPQARRKSKIGFARFRCLSCTQTHSMPNPLIQGGQMAANIRVMEVRHQPVRTELSSDT
jgi:hypothetical protein